MNLCPGEDAHAIMKVSPSNESKKPCPPFGKIMTTGDVENTYPPPGYLPTLKAVGTVEMYGPEIGLHWFPKKKKKKKKRPLYWCCFPTAPGGIAAIPEETIPSTAAAPATTRTPGGGLDAGSS